LCLPCVSTLSPPSGSTEILLRSKARGLAVSVMAGQRFGGDGDFFGVAYNGDNPIHACGCGERPLKEMDGKEV
jgi:cholesterol oxidase